MSRFRTQPMLDSVSLHVTAYEVLSAQANRLPYGDAKAMAANDLAALEYAIQVLSQTGLRTHANLEWTTLMLAPKRVADMVRPEIVIELVERYIDQAVAKGSEFDAILDAILQIRRRGGVIAMDDMVAEGVALRVAQRVRPEIIKVETRDDLESLRRQFRQATFIAERIESEHHADMAKKLGAHELQGFWCDAKIACAPKTTEDLQIVPAWTAAPT